jgi:23S rRNA (guanosine2251-2'-O)-methyltransferase
MKNKNFPITDAQIYGLHAVKSLLENSPDRVVRLYLLKAKSSNTMDKILADAESFNVPIKWLSKEGFDQRFPQVNHQGVAAECFKPRHFSEDDLEKLVKDTTIQPFFLVLDGVQDPHNLGACLRSADAAGVHAVIIPKDRSVGVTATVSKVACGAAETVPVVTVTNLARTLNFLKENNIWCIGLDGEAKTSIYQFKLTGALAFVLGAEGKGLRRLTAEVCDALVSIPMQGRVSSLNVSVATGVVLFESLRQKTV